MSKYPDLINDSNDTLAIIQGETYLKLLDGAITVSGDWTGVTPRGQIRDTYLNDSEILYAEFEFEDSVYDEETDTTTIKPFLSASATQNIPYTKWREGQVFAPKKNVHVYDIEIEKEGVVKKLAFGYVQVIGEITGSGAPIVNKEVYLVASNNLSELTDLEVAQSNLFPGGIPGGSPPDLSDYATTTALNEGLATRQPIGDYLTPDDIGETVQPYDANTVIDPNYIATEESFTTAEKNKLSEIESEAQVNVYKESIVLYLGAIDTDLEPKERAAILPELPYNLEIQELILKGEGVNGAPTGSAFIVDLNVNGVSILSTEISIDDGALSSKTATIPYVLATTRITKGSALTVNIDQVGSTNPGQNIVLVIDGVRYE
jgi:hypothetical protein